MSDRKTLFVIVDCDQLLSKEPYSTVHSETIDHPEFFSPVFREIVDNHEKENALNIVTDERTYQVFAESPEDARYSMLTIIYLCVFHNWA